MKFKFFPDILVESSSFYFHMGFDPSRLFWLVLNDGVLFEDFYGVAFLGYFLIINLDPRREEKVKRYTAKIKTFLGIEDTDVEKDTSRV
jgi:hypothetical protein